MQNRDQQFGEALEALLPALTTGEVEAVRSARRLLGVLAERGPISLREDASRLCNAPDKALRNGTDAIARALRGRNTATAAAPILVIEDDELVSAALAIHLSELGREVLETPDLATARHLIATRSPAAVILDIMLQSDEDGRDLLATHGADTAFVVISAIADDPAVHQECRALGARATLAKPVMTDELISTMETLLTRASAVESPDNAHVLALLRHRTHLTEEDMAASSAGISDLSWDAAVRGHLDACDKCREAYYARLRD